MTKIGRGDFVCVLQNSASLSFFLSAKYARDQRLSSRLPYLVSPSLRGIYNYSFRQTEKRESGLRRSKLGDGGKSRLGISSAAFAKPRKKTETRC